MKKIIFGVLFIFSYGLLLAENNETTKPKQIMVPANNAELPAKIELSTTFISQHLWRALPSGNAPAIEPLISFKSGKFSMNAWGAQAVNNSYREFNFYVSHTFKNFTLGLFDYYCPSIQNPNPAFFDYKSESTKHLIEYQIQYNGSKEFPIQLMYGQFVHGFDTKENGKQYFSKYFEVSYAFDFKSYLIKMEVGMTPEKGMYANHATIFNFGFSICNKIRIYENTEIPVIYKLVYNKETQDLYFNIALKLFSF